MKLANRIILLLLIISLATSIASAKEIKMSINQTEYYFLIGEQGIINIEFNNPYEEPIEGIMSYTITQETNQGGMQYSGTNSQSEPFTAPKNKETIILGVGSSNNPITSTIDLSFSYENETVELKNIKVHFVEDQSQKKNEENKKESSKKNQQQEQAQQKQQEQQEQLQEQMEQMQQQMEQVFQNQPTQKQSAQQNTQDKLQNNQMTQDSEALKEQMQRELIEKEEMKKAFQENLGNNNEFQKQHQELLDRGYELKSGNLDPDNQTSGNFELNYEKQGETASIKGKMENNQIKDIQKTSSEDMKKAMQTLEKDPRFQKHQMNLVKNQFSPLTPKIEQQGNTTTVKIPYENKNNETATISAKIENGKIEEVKLEQSKKQRWWLWLLTITLLGTTGYLAYKKYIKKKQEGIEKNKIQEKPIDYKKEAKKILELAKQLFENKKEKDAYGKAAESIRFYYSHKLNLKTELTNTDLIRLLKNHKIEYEQTQKCLNLCGLVEFAKYIANKNDFDEITQLAENIIK